MAGEPAVPLCQAMGIPGGLCVQVGSPSTDLAVELARSGRFLVEVLDVDAARVDGLRQRFQAEDLYGLIVADRWSSPSRLPYAEDLVNVVVLADHAKLPVSLEEVGRVLRPGGIVLLAAGPDREAELQTAGLQRVPAEGPWRMARKPWPATIDQWTHARHGADGNTVSLDTQVGPPRRVRWVAGALRENSRLVSAAGRNFYADLLARDAFNGLRLWTQPLRSWGPAAPASDGQRLFTVSDKKLLALDAATGEILREYTDAGTPRDLMVADGLLVTVDGQTVRGLEVGTGRLCWKYEASEPRYVIAGDGAVYLLQGSERRGEATAAVSLELATGKVRWQKDDYPWAAKVRRLVYQRGLVVCEVSTHADEKLGNAIHVVAAADGRVLWSRDYVPGMNHAKQARAMFIGDDLWVLEYLKCVALDPKTGQVRREAPAGHCHCFPPVATARYMFGGEMDLTDLASGEVDANRITKANCSRDFGWVPANGLIYVCPKHCVCWPMLRGYAALAPERPGRETPQKKVEDLDFVLETGVAPPAATGDGAEPWPCYRQNAWRSASTPEPVPVDLKPIWTTTLGDRPEGPIADDWRENPFARGPVTPPVIAGGLVYVARPDARQLVALEASTGAVRWQATVAGRVDTAPTIHRGLCLLGTKSGWVYALRADDGRLIWRLRAAPGDEQIIAYGQLESPWPVPGSVLVVDDVAYFAAGRQPLADGGILVFAVEPASGKIRWVRRLDSLPMTNFYASIGLEFDNFDLLQREGDGVAMARWVFDRASGAMTCKAREAFLHAATGSAGVIVPRGCWSYAPRHQPRHRRDTPQRGLVAFQGDTLLGCLDDYRTLYRRDFDAESVAKFDRTWLTGWAVSEHSRKEGTGPLWLSHRLAKEATWSLPLFADAEPKQKVVALVLAGDTLWAAGSEGGLTGLSAKDGKILARCPLAAPVWDGMAAADGRLVVSTQEGGVVCLGR